MGEKISSDEFKSMLIKEIKNWNIDDLTIYKKVPVGYEFVNSQRTVDIIVEANNKSVGINTIIQSTSGSSYKRAVYLLEDAKKAPIPILIVFADTNDVFKEDIKAQLIASGLGIQLNIDNNELDKNYILMLKQRICIELGLEWLKYYSDKEV